ncbi:MAG: thioredoxin domain-containing protein [Candidatus Micrarchaeia archaeon]
MTHVGKPALSKAQYLAGIVILCAAVLLGIVAFVGMGSPGNALEGASGGNLQAGAQSGSASPQAQSPLLQNGSVATGSGGEAQVPQVSPPAKEVTIDFLYADWCSHCQAMKPIVAKLEASLPKDRFAVRYWNEASRGNATVAEVYEEYTQKGYFTGFPTFVANGNDPLVGSRPEATFTAWVCGKFLTPKPEGC